jgi:hypothetical protein
MSTDLENNADISPIPLSIPGRPTGTNMPVDWEIDLEISADSVGFHQGPRQRRSGAKLIIWSWAAAVIDFCLISGIGLIFLASFLVVVNSQWGGAGNRGNEFLFIAGAGVVGILAFFYMIMLRSFLGFTVGEWACDLRLGSPQQRQSKFYTIQVLIRCGVLFATGIIFLPVFGLLLGKDIPGKLSGLSLFSLR